MKDNNQLSKSLIALLANSYALYIKTQNYHWNITGPNFYSLHSLFEDQYKELAEALDLIAEHIRTLNIRVPASFASYSESSTIKDGNENADSNTMIKELLEDHQVILQYLSNVMEEAKKIDDEATLDLAVERTRAHDKHAWMLKSSR